MHPVSACAVSIAVVLTQLVVDLNQLIRMNFNSTSKIPVDRVANVRRTCEQSSGSSPQLEHVR